MRRALALGGLFAVAACAPTRVPLESVGVAPESSPPAAEATVAQTATSSGPRIYVDGRLVSGPAAPSGNSQAQAAAVRSGPAIYVDGRLISEPGAPSRSGPAIYVDGRRVEPAN